MYFIFSLKCILKIPIRFNWKQLDRYILFGSNDTRERESRPDKSSRKIRHLISIWGRVSRIENDLWEEERARADLVYYERVRHRLYVVCYPHTVYVLVNKCENAAWRQRTRMLRPASPTYAHSANASRIIPYLFVKDYVHLPIFSGSPYLLIHRVSSSVSLNLSPMLLRIPDDTRISVESVRNYRDTSHVFILFVQLFRISFSFLHSQTVSTSLQKSMSTVFTFSFIFKLIVFVQDLKRKANKALK